MVTDLTSIVVPAYEKIVSAAEFTPKEVLDILGISKSTLYNNHTQSWEAQMKEIPYFEGRFPERKKINGIETRVYSVDDIYALIEFSSFYGSNRRNFVSFEENLKKHEIKMCNKSLDIAKTDLVRADSMNDLAAKIIHKYGL